MQPHEKNSSFQFLVDLGETKIVAALLRQVVAAWVARLIIFIYCMVGVGAQSGDNEYLCFIHRTSRPVGGLEDAARTDRRG